MRDRSLLLDWSLQSTLCRVRSIRDVHITVCGCVWLADVPVMSTQSSAENNSSKMEVVHSSGCQSGNRLSSLCSVTTSGIWKRTVFLQPGAFINLPKSTVSLMPSASRMAGASRARLAGVQPWILSSSRLLAPFSSSLCLCVLLGWEFEKRLGTMAVPGIPTSAQASVAPPSLPKLSPDSAGWCFFCISRLTPKVHHLQGFPEGFQKGRHPGASLQKNDECLSSDTGWPAAESVRRLSLQLPAGSSFPNHALKVVSNRIKLRCFTDQDDPSLCMN